MRITNTFTKSLDRIELSGTDYAACYLELVEGLRGALSVDGYSPDERRYLEEMYRRMETWVRVSQGFLAPVD